MLCAQHDMKYASMESPDMRELMLIKYNMSMVNEKLNSGKRKKRFGASLVLRLKLELS